MSAVKRQKIHKALTTTSTKPASVQVSPPSVVKKAQSVLEKAMAVDKNIVDELLLICGVIGTTDENDLIIPVTDCLNWLQDLQRALRRDEDLYRPISLLLGQWKVVQQKLLPLALSCRYDSALILTICKILVILTKPLSENTKRAGKAIINTKKTHKDVVDEQIRMRDNALLQAEQLLEYKRIFCHHPSHLANRANKDEGGVLSIFVSLLAEPLSKTGNSRTDTDHLTIELVLHLLRNLLSAEPLLYAQEVHKQLHCELISLLDRELVLDVLLVLAADIEQRENMQYNLLLMELLHYILRYQDPTAVARCSLQGLPFKSRSNSNATNSTTDIDKKPGLLKEKLQRERQAVVSLITSRHSHFAGCVTLKSNRIQNIHLLATPVETTRSTVSKRSKTSFVGPASRLHQHSAVVSTDDRSVISNTRRVIHNFCTRFVKECYGSVMKSLKSEFRRDSVRLEDTDRVIFFRLVWFFYQWWRQCPDINSNSKSIGQFVFTMDVFTFNLVLNATDSFEQHKMYPRLAQAVALISEMIHVLHYMYDSSEETERLMALGLMDRLFYSNDSLDRLPKFFSRWKPGTMTSDYMCDLAELCHMQLKLLDKNAEACLISGEEDKKDTVTKMKARAAEFDVSAYFARKIVSNQTVHMYTELLTHYDTNAKSVNHRIIAFFLRLCKQRIAVAEPKDSDMPANPLATKTVTLQPMMYNMDLFQVLHRILNDQSIRTNNKEFEHVIKFASDLVFEFSKAAKSNPLLFVEALFKQSIPHRFCDLVTNDYVDEELRMLYERELLLEEQFKLDDAEHEQNNNDGKDEEDEEMEFNDDYNTIKSQENPSKTKDSVTKVWKRVLEDSGDDDDDNKSCNNTNNEMNRQNIEEQHDDVSESSRVS